MRQRTKRIRHICRLPPTRMLDQHFDKAVRRSLPNLPRPREQIATIPIEFAFTVEHD